MPAETHASRGGLRAERRSCTLTPHSTLSMAATGIHTTTEGMREMKKSFIIGALVAAVILALASIAGTSNATEQPNNAPRIVDSK